MERLYIVVREDLPPGLQIAQSCHALRQFVEHFPTIDRDWYTRGNNIVVLKVADEGELVRLVRVLMDHQIEVASFFEPDLDEQMTAFACSQRAKAFLRRLPLALAA